MYVSSTASLIVTLYQAALLTMQESSHYTKLHYSTQRMSTRIKKVKSQQPINAFPPPPSQPHTPALSLCEDSF